MAPQMAENANPAMLDNSAAMPTKATIVIACEVIPVVASVAA